MATTLKKLIAQVSTKLDNSLIIFVLLLENINWLTITVPYNES